MRLPTLNVDVKVNTSTMKKDIERANKQLQGIGGKAAAFAGGGVGKVGALGSLGGAEPVYEALPGWESSTCDARKLEDLPAKARAYLDRIEELTGAPVQWVSVGTRRDQIIPVA